MKRELALTFAAATLSVSLMADVAQIDGLEWTYSLADGHAVVEGVEEGFEGSLSIPSKIGGYPVKRIGTGAFKMQTGITSVTIPEGVTEIGEYAFSECEGLTKVDVPDSLTHIEGYAFSYCMKLESIDLPDTLQRIGLQAFIGCQRLSIGDYVVVKGRLYDYFGEDSDLVIPDGVTDITEWTFYGWDNITSVTMPDSVTNIESMAFFMCSNLHTIEFGSGLENIADLAFHECTSLSSISFPDAVRRIGVQAFQGCTSLNAVRFGAGTASMKLELGYDSFSRCSALANISFLGELPSGLADSGIFSSSPKVRCQKAFADDYAKVVPEGLFIGYLSNSFNEWVTSGDCEFQSSGETAWIGTYDDSHDVSGSLQSGTLQSGSYPVLSTTVTGPVRVSFWWKTKGGDYAYDSGHAFVSVDGTAKGWLTDRLEPAGIAIGGNTDWQNVSFDIKETGAHKIEWTFKRGFNADGCVLIDEFSATPLVTVTFDLLGGSMATSGSVSEPAGTLISLPDAADCTKPYHTLIGWNCVTMPYRAGTSYTIPCSDTTLTAIWLQNCLADPAISCSGIGASGMVETESTTITMSAEKGAAIHYTLDGAQPTESSPLYEGPITTCARSFTIKAIAVKDNYISSSVVERSLRRAPHGLREILDISATNIMITSGGDVQWERILGADASDGIAALKCGALQSGQKAWVELTVIGSGNLSYRWKSGVPGTEGTNSSYTLYIDGQLFSRLEGSAEWMSESCCLENGTHTFRWECVWNSEGTGVGRGFLDMISWEQFESPAPFPELGLDATPGAVSMALSGTKDQRVLNHIKNARDYANYRAWAQEVSKTFVARTMSDEMKMEAIKESPHAWLSYALDAGRLLETPPTESDVKIAGFSNSDIPGVFNMTVSVEGISIGDNATPENLAEIFGVEGSATLNEDGFSSDNVQMMLLPASEGKVQILAMPLQAINRSFFFRVKMTP